MKKDNQIKKYKYLTAKLKNQQGVTAIVVAIVVSVLIGFVALAVDVGYLYATKNQLQNAADAASLAGAGLLGDIYESDHDKDLSTYTLTNEEISAIEDIVQDTASENRATGVNIDIDNSDSSAKNIFIGQYTSADRKFKETHTGATAVQVIARRDSTVTAGKVSTFFARIFGIDAVPVKARATAALTGKREAGEGEVELPVGLSIDRFTGEVDDWCGDIIKFAPTTDPDACSGWTEFTDHQPTPGHVADILDGNTLSPVILSDFVEFEFKGGVVANLFDNMLNAFQRRHLDDMGTDNTDDDYDKAYNVAYFYETGKSPDAYDTPYYGDDGFPVAVAMDEDAGPVPNAVPDDYDVPDGCYGCTLQGPVPIALRDNQGDIVYDQNTGLIVQDTYPDDDPRYERRWETTVLVYDSSSCNPNTDIRIAGFAKVLVYDVHEMPENTISARIMCDYAELAHGGGGDFGVFGSIPNLVVVELLEYL